MTRMMLNNNRQQQRKSQLLLIGIGFGLGFFVSTVAILNANVIGGLVDRRLERGAQSGLSTPAGRDSFLSSSSDASSTGTSFYYGLRARSSRALLVENNEKPVNTDPITTTTTDLVAPIHSSKDISVSSSSSSIASAVSTASRPSSLQDLRILVAIAAFDFNQIPFLESVLDSYHDICVGGAKVDVVIHATVAYPVTFIDLLNSRFTCEDFSVQIVLKPASLRLHLVDCHRELFYDRINDYDLFIYTEEDIQVTPRTVATYMQESRYIEETMKDSTEHSFADFNVGIVRYEYNYPSNVVIDDKTRHAIQNVTRVYWEHSSYKGPLIPNAVDSAPQGSGISERYVYMQNHHQGMFMATKELLLAWKDRPNCEFNIAKNRPGTSSQPSEGTQRVWMSSQQLMGKRHCNVQQVLPKDKFGALTVLHLPNKNYRRVGKYHKREFSDGTEEFEQSPDLLSALQLHLAMRKEWPNKPQTPYRGPVTMIDEVKRKRTPMIQRRMQEYRAYAERGGVLSDYDFTRTALVEDQ